MAMNAVAIVGALGLFSVQDLASGGANKKVVGGGAYEYTAVAFSEDGSMLAAGALSALGVVVYDTQTGGILFQNSSAQVTGLSFNATLKRLAVATNNAPYFLLYDTETWGRLTPPITLSGYGATSCAFSPDGAFLAFTHGNASIYRTSNWSKLTTSGAFSSTPLDCAFSPDSAFFAVVGSSPALSVHNTSTGALVPAATYVGAYGKKCTFSPDGTKLVIGIDRSPAAVFFTTGTWARLTAPSASFDAVVSACVFSPSSDELLLGTTTAPFLRRVDVSTMTAAAAGIPASAAVQGIAYADAGARYIRANVRDIDGNLAQRTLRVRLRSDGTRQAEAVSDPATGDVEVKVYGGDVEYDAQFMAADGEPLNDLFFARVSSSET